jgi:hypothetical protein
VSELLRLPNSAPGLTLAEPGEDEGAAGRAGAHRREREDRFVKAARAAFPGADDGAVRRAANVIDQTISQDAVTLITWPDRRARFHFGSKPKADAYPPETTAHYGGRAIVSELLRRIEKKRGSR